MPCIGLIVCLMEEAVCKVMLVMQLFVQAMCKIQLIMCLMQQTVCKMQLAMQLFVEAMRKIKKQLLNNCTLFSSLTPANL